MKHHSSRTFFGMKMGRAQATIGFTGAMFFAWLAISEPWGWLLVLAFLITAVAGRSSLQR